MKKTKFAVVGAGWRAEYFLRVAKSHEEEFEVVGVLCRRAEKVKLMQEKFNVPATMNEEEIIAAKPDFIVVSVAREAAWTIASKWKNRGFCVIVETPSGETLEEIEEIKKTLHEGGKLLVAEQYRYYPSYKKIIDAVREGMIGKPVCVNASVAHDYHGFDVIRELLLESFDAPFKMRTEKYDLPVTKTGDRFNIYTDGEIITRTRAKVDIVYKDGKVGFYDFDSDQYHSTIRHNTLKVTGTRGEIIDGVCYYLDDNNEMQISVLVDDFQFAREEKSDDETAVYTLMKLASKVNEVDSLSKEEKETVMALWLDNINCGLTDAYMTIMMNKPGDWIEVNNK